MKKVLAILCCLVVLLLPTIQSNAGEGHGTVRLGYVYTDETGNLESNHSTFNEYEGAILSLETFRYLFDNGIRADLDLNRISLNNRNIKAGLSRSGLFDIDITNNQYRRIYDFDGSTYTRRHQTGVATSVSPNKYVTILGGGNFYGRSGKTADLFDPVTPAAPIEVDYEQMSYNGGARFNKNGRMFQAMCRYADFTDNLNPERDQSRFSIRLDSYFPVPHYEDKLVLSGGFRRFESEFENASNGLKSNTVWGSALARVHKNISVKYSFLFDRTSSDSDFVATDNIVNSGYITYTFPTRGGVTAGYQHDINDDYTDEVKANSFYFSGWWKPSSQIEMRASHGMRAEEVKTGSRLIGDQDFGRYKLSVKYRNDKIKHARVYFEGRSRENDQLGSESEFNRIGLSAATTIEHYGDISVGYSYSKGEYVNQEQTFEFGDHFAHVDIFARAIHSFTPGFGASYYRSKRDLDVESIMLRFTGSYRFAHGYRLDAKYNVYNFDDFLVRDQYYTANIVEVSLAKDITIK